MTDWGYTRISLDSKASGSIDKQGARLCAFCPTVQILEERSVSAAKVPFADRPVGGQLLRDLRPGDRVLFTKIDRAARNVTDLLKLVETIDAKGASVIFVDQNIEFSGPMGRFLLTLLGAIAELEAAIVSERRRESLEAFNQEGRHAVGKAPFGFRSITNPDGRGLVIALDPVQAPRLRQAIDRVLAGESQESVRHSIGMSKTGFHRLLRNPRLAGMTPDNGSVVMIDGVPRVNRDAALLSMAEWRRLQEAVGATKAWSRTDGYGAAMRCGVCGDRLYKNINANPQWNVYRCRKVRGAHLDGRAAPSITCHLADDYIEKTFLLHHGQEPYMIRDYVDDASTKIEAVSMAQVRIAELQKRLLSSASASDDEFLMSQLLDARASLREAEAMGSSRSLVDINTGLTKADVWAMGDSDKRCELLNSADMWVLHLGRGPVHERLTFNLPGFAESDQSTDVAAAASDAAAN